MKANFGHLIQYTDIAADFDRADTSVNMFEMEKPPAVPTYEPTRPLDRSSIFV
jgi:hypothetical protein